MATKAKKRNVRYQVDIELSADDIAKAGAALSFKVRASGWVLGTIEVGQGAFRWRGAYDQKFRRLEWKNLFQMLERRST